jgi:lipopolysaccharide export system protein LptA
LLGVSGVAFAAVPKNGSDKDAQQLEVSAEKSLEYYQDKKLYVARGGAKATRGAMVITADVLTAHERDKTAGAPKKNADEKGGMGDIDQMTAEGNVVITDPKQRITGQHAVYDLNEHKMVVTGHNLRYETAKEVVTAHDSLEYYEDTKLAVARGHAVADQEGRHIEGDILTAEFRDAPNGQTQLTKMTAQGHVAVVTKSKDSDKGKSSGGDVSLGNKAVYDPNSNIAIISGDVRISRKDGTQLSGDVGEVDFNKNKNRLMNDGTGRVRALLPSTPANKATTP